MQRWIRFFFGTPRRFVISAVVIVILMTVIHFQPGLVFQLTDRLVAESWPVIQSVLVILIVLGGLRIIVFGRGSGGRRR